MRRFAIALVMFATAATLAPAGASNHYTKLTDVRLAMSDGVRLTADVYVPTRVDGDGDGLYPCVVEVTPYRKESRYAEGAGYLPAEGIALIEVDARGTGGSEGEYDFTFSVREQADAAEWIEWAATTATKDGTAGGAKLCEGTVGMFGGSYSGIIQYLVASLPSTARGDVPAAPPHLAAIAPQRAYGDLYRDIVYHGGMVIGSFGSAWSSGTTAYFTQPPMDVNTDNGRKAWTDHLTKNDPMLVPYLSNQFADADITMDDSNPQYQQKLYEDSSALSRIENLRVPTLHLAGWFDAFTRGQLRTFREAYALERSLGDRGPNHLIVGPWNHSGTHFVNPTNFRDRLRDWYLYWLEGRANGAAEPDWFAGPRVTWFQTQTGTINDVSAAAGEWKTSNEWPPAELSGVQRMYLHTGGTLNPIAPTAAEATDSYAYSPAAGAAETLSRWDNAAGTPHPQLDQNAEKQGVSFESGFLLNDVKVAGPIGMKLWLGTQGVAGDPSQAATWPGIAQMTPPYHDTDIVVKVSDVSPDGSARLVTQGYLRASHRAVDASKSEYIGGEMVAPYHPHTAATLDVPPADGTPREYAIEIWPAGKTFARGHKIRIDISSADTPNHLTLLKPAINTLYHDATHPSYLSIPVL